MARLAASGTARRHLRRAHSAAGMTLIEVLVAMGIFAAVTAIIAMIVVSSNSVTTTAQEGVYTQASLLDAVNRVTRDTSAAVPIMAALDNDVTFKVQQGGRCAQSRYYLNTTGVLTSEVRTATSAQCPESWATIAPSTTVLATKITTEHIFTYYDFQNRVLPAPVKDLTLVARVGIAVKAAVKDRPNGVNLVTSAAIATGISPNLTVMTNGTVATPTLRGTLTGNTATLTWTSDPTYTGFVLYRDGVVLARINDPATLTYDDPRLSPGTTYVYTVVGISAAGTSQPSNPVTLKPVVGVLPNNPGSGPTKVSVEEPPADGCTTTPVLKDDSGTGGLTADYCQVTTPGEPITQEVPTSVPVYGWVPVTTPVYGRVRTEHPVYGWVDVLTPHMVDKTTTTPVYGPVTKTTDVYGWVPGDPVYTPVYGPVPVYRTVTTYDWVTHNARVSIVPGMTQKCYVHGSAPLPNPACGNFDWSKYRYWPYKFVAWKYGGNDPNASIMNEPDKAYVTGGSCDSYTPMKVGTKDQPDLGMWTPTGPGDANGRWARNGQMGWWTICFNANTQRFEPVKTTQVFDHMGTGIVGTTSTPGPPKWVVQYTVTTTTQEIIGYTTTTVKVQDGWDHTPTWMIVGYTYTDDMVQTGTETKLVWQQIGTTPGTRTIITGYGPPDYVKTYTLRWAGTGPCPTVDNLPMSKTTHNLTQGAVPQMLTLHYDSVSQSAWLSEDGLPERILTVNVPRQCTY